MSRPRLIQRTGSKTTGIEFDAAITGRHNGSLELFAVWNRRPAREFNRAQLYASDIAEMSDAKIAGDPQRS